MPIGFDKSKVNTSKKKTEEAKTTQKPDTAGKNASVESEDDDDYFNISRDTKKNKKLLYAAVAVAGLIAIGIGYSVMNSSDKPAIEDASDASDASGDGTGSNTANGGNQSDEDEDPYIYDEKGNPIYSSDDNSVVNGDAIKPGESNYEESTQGETTSKVFDPDDMLKDINGVDISATYNVISRDYVYDYVSYTAKRGIIDDGMEIYWLEAEYCGKKYRIQVPFYYFKDFSEKGVCRVQIEVLNIEGGGKVISYMQVVQNPSDEESSEE